LEVQRTTLDTPIDFPDVHSGRDHQRRNINLDVVAGVKLRVIVVLGADSMAPGVVHEIATSHVAAASDPPATSVTFAAVHVP